MACRFFLGEKELSRDELTSFMKNLPHEKKLEIAPEIAKDSYQRLSWTPGEAQAARYDLSKQVKKVHYMPDLQGGTLAAEGLEGRTVLDKQGIKPEQIADYVGKDVAKKLLETKQDSNGIHTLEGLDLKVGGEGMKGFYDQIIPKALEKIGKEHGVKVKQGSVGDGYQALDKNGEVVAGFKDKASAEQWIKKMFGRYTLKDNTQPIHYIDLPQSLKDQAMHKGFPLFSGGYQFLPVVGNPFEDKKK